MLSATKHILTLNSFELLYHYSKNIIKSNNVLPTEVINVDIYQDKNNDGKIIKYNDTTISNGNTKSVPKQKKKEKRKSEKTVTDIAGDSIAKDVFG